MGRKYYPIWGTLFHSHLMRILVVLAFVCYILRYIVTYVSSEFFFYLLQNLHCL